jgi:hypothetical protein
MTALVKITRLPPFLKVCGVLRRRGPLQADLHSMAADGGYYESRGACEYCSRSGEAFCGPGFRYQNGEKVTDNIIAQVLTLNGSDVSPTGLDRRPPDSQCRAASTRSRLVAA